MKTKSFIIPLLVGISLISCNKKELRADIEKFISNFSLEVAVEHYKKVDMVRTVNVDDGQIKTKQVETITFDVTDVNKPQYRHQIDDYTEENLTNTSVSYLEYVDETIYYIANSNRSETTLEKAHELIQRFFYTKTALDGTVHDGGYYRGDMLINSAYYIQNNITIDEEQETMVVDKDVVDAQGVNTKSHEVIDKYGMMTYKKTTSSKDEKSSITEINIQNH